MERKASDYRQGTLINNCVKVGQIWMSAYELISLFKNQTILLEQKEIYAENDGQTRTDRRNCEQYTLELELIFPIWKWNFWMDHYVLYQYVGYVLWFASDILYCSKREAKYFYIRQCLWNIFCYNEKIQGTIKYHQMWNIFMICWSLIVQFDT